MTENTKMICPKVFQDYPPWYSMVNCVVAVITLLFGIYTNLLIHYATPKNVDKSYKMSIMIQEGFVTISTIYTCLTAPVQYVPSALVVISGILKVNACMDVLLDVLGQVVVCCITVSTVVHRCCSVRYGRDKPKCFYIFIICFNAIAICPYTVHVAYASSIYDSKEAARKLFQDCPHMIEALKYDHFVYFYSAYLVETTVILVLLSAASIFVAAVVAVILYNRYLSSPNVNVSDYTKKLQHKLLQYLAIQGAVPTIIHAIPTITILILTYYGCLIDIYISTCLWFLGAFHGIVSCSVIIFINRYYSTQAQKDLKNMLICFRKET